MKDMLPQLDYWKRYDELSDNRQFEELYQANNSPAQKSIAT